MDLENKKLPLGPLKSTVLNKILDGLKADIYVTDINTDEIIYMNKTMKRDFDLENPEGKICFKVLQKDKKCRCEKCPIERLKYHPEEDFVFQWDEYNTVTKRSYRNYDSLIEWFDGRIVHLQQSVDVTELKSANTDELTLFQTRRSGKESLKKLLKYAAQEDFSVTVCLYDVNLLKEVNDNHGHAEGDRLIIAISEVVRKALAEPEFAFRLSGDEFVIAFICNQKEAKRRLKKIIEKLRLIDKEYEISFCYGLVEVSPGSVFTSDELLFLADKRMYEQKRSYHISVNEKKLKGAVGNKKNAPWYFEYDRERLYDALVQSTDDYIYVCNMKTGIFKYPKTMVEEFDLPGQVIENAAAVWGSKVHQDDKAAFLEANQEIADGRTISHCVEYRTINKRGEWVWVRCRGYLERDENGEPLLFAGFITNLGKKNKIDNLTGLFNKLEFGEQIAHLLSLGEQFSVMLLGIDDLKHINDLYNRSFGDEVIRIASQKLHSLLPEEAAVYRLDGDEFGVLVRGGTRETMESYYRAVYHSFKNQQSYEGKKYYCTLSGGCIFCPEDAGSYEDILKYADYCMEFSKAHGKKQCTNFSHSILDERARSLEMVEFLRESVENDFGGFSLLFQPLVEAASGKLLGVEALARWECEKLGAVSPVEFIPLLESTGLIVNVGKWILKRAILAGQKWVALNSEFVIDVNLSYVQMQDSNFLSYVRAVMKEENFSPQNLVLELTESYFVKENELIRNIFDEIREMGVRIAMDDFGTGYSTLGILKESPADIVKIDKTFIRNINNSNFDATFIRFVVELCHAVGIQVCLEGVETRDIYEIVSHMGLDMIQGYLFDKPLSEDVFTEKYFGNANMNKL